jgi:hypothetical protein
MGRYAAVLFGVMLLALPTPALAQSPLPTLTGEFLLGTTTVISTTCSSVGGTATWSASGTASGPYPGTFVERGTAPSATLPTQWDSTFTITSGEITITGTKHLSISPFNGGVCIGSAVNGWVVDLTYSATISTPAGSFHDEGSAHSQAALGGGVSGGFIEDFESSLAAPIPLLPTSKEQCKNGRFGTFAVFKNQGDCVSFLASGGKNSPR